MILSDIPIPYIIITDNVLHLTQATNYAVYKRVTDFARFARVETSPYITGDFLLDKHKLRTKPQCDNSVC